MLSVAWFTIGTALFSIMIYFNVSDELSFRLEQRATLIMNYSRHILLRNIIRQNNNFARQPKSIELCFNENQP